MILNQPDGSRIEQQEEEPTAKAQMAALGERLKELQGQRDRLVPVFEVPGSLREPDFERIRAIVREEVQAGLLAVLQFDKDGNLLYALRNNESATAPGGFAIEWKSNLRNWEHHGMTYRGYSLTDLDTMIDFYRMHHVERSR